MPIPEKAFSHYADRMLMFGEHIGAALKRSEYMPLEGGAFAMRVEGLRGVIATGPTVEECREDLIEAIGERITMRLERGLEIPALNGRAIGVSRESIAVV
jgi:predicted RNase H-like HicB family nuclease